MKSRGGAQTDVLVIGAGQAGLACGRALAAGGLSFVIHERHARVGDSWRKRYGSLTLFTPRAYSALPGRSLAGDPEGYPSKDELADYLEQYAAAFSLPVVTGVGIIRLEREGAAFVAQTALGRRVHAAAVIVAAGGFQLPIVPAFAEHLTPSIVQLDATTYQSPQQIPSGRVLIVGAGATGRQLARELAASHQVSLSSGGRRFILPQRVLGRDHLWWSEKSGGLRADKNTPLGRIARVLDAFPGMYLHDRALTRLGIRVVPRTLDGRGAEFRFANRTSETFDTVIWTMRYRDDVSWLAVSGAIGSDGKLLEERGVSPVPGLFYVGRDWQNSRASGLLCGVASDADKVVGRVKLYLSGSLQRCGGGPQRSTGRP